MVTAEGVFPKIGNDPLYASEVNNFSNSSQFVGLISVIGSVTSGGGFTNFGSVFIGPGSINRPYSQIEVNTNITRVGAGDGVCNPEIRYSGTVLGSTLSFPLNDVNGSSLLFQRITLGSTRFAGPMSVFTTENATNSAHRFIGSFAIESGLVVFIGVGSFNNNTTHFQLGPSFVQTNRGTFA